MLERMEEGGNSAERAMAAKYAKAIKADQVLASELRLNFADMVRVRPMVNVHIPIGCFDTNGLVRRFWSVF